MNRNVLNVSTSSSSLSTSGEAILYGRFAASLFGAGLESRVIEAESVSLVNYDVVPIPNGLTQAREHVGIQLHCVHQARPLGEESRQESPSGADLEDHIILRYARGHYPGGIGVLQEVLSEAFFRRAQLGHRGLHL